MPSFPSQKRICNPVKKAWKYDRRRGERRHFKFDIDFFLLQITSVESRLDAVQSGSNLIAPQDQLNLMIRLCLTDSNFPDFVEAVEKELKSLTSLE